MCVCTVKERCTAAVSKEDLHSFFVSSGLKEYNKKLELIVQVELTLVSVCSSRLRLCLFWSIDCWEDIRKPL